jgi:putative transcriptional regulator
MSAKRPTSHGGAIKALREKLGLTQWQIASQCGLTSSQIGAIEQNKCPLPLERAMAIAKALGVTMNDLFYEDEPECEEGTTVWKEV